MIFDAKLQTAFVAASVKTAVKSNLVSAILSARAGLFAEAERELNAELRKNPHSVKARKMLRQVQNWRKN